MDGVSTDFATNTVGVLKSTLFSPLCSEVGEYGGPMLNITAKQDTMRNIVDILTVLVEDAKFKFEEGHIEVRAVDAMHVAMVRMEIDAAAFEAWVCEPCTIGFEL